MRTMAALVAGLVLAITASGCSQPSGAAAAADAMGATNLNSIQFSGSGTNNAYGQAYSPGGPWPRFEVKNYIAAVDYQTPAMRLEMLRAQGEHPPRGGGAQPFAIDQRTIQVVSGKSAWSEGGAQPAPNPGAVTDRLRQIWLTPHGVIKAAMASGTPPTGNVFTFKAEDRDVKVTLNQENLVERVEYLTTNSVVGDVPVEITYSDYAQFGEIQFPRHIVEKQDGFPTLDIMIADVQPNAAVSLPVPQNVASAPAPPAVPMPTIEKVSDGLWSLNAAGTRSLAVEFADHIVMLEGPTSDARSKVVNELVRQTVPNKPIRYVVNTHAHYDHAGGLRQYVAEGITVITHENNKSFFEQVWARPRTVAPDPAPTSNTPMIETVGDKKVLSDLYANDRAVSHAEPRSSHRTANRVSAEGADPDVRRRLQPARRRRHSRARARAGVRRADGTASERTEAESGADRAGAWPGGAVSEPADGLQPRSVAQRDAVRIVRFDMFRVVEADLRVGFPLHAVPWLVVLEHSSRQRRASAGLGAGGQRQVQPWRRCAQPTGEPGVDLAARVPFERGRRVLGHVATIVTPDSDQPLRPIDGVITSAHTGLRPPYRDPVLTQSPRTQRHASA